MKRSFIVLSVFLSACSALETRPVKVTSVYPPGSIRPDAPVTRDQAGAKAEPVSAPAYKAGQQWAYRRRNTTICCQSCVTEPNGTVTTRMISAIAATLGAEAKKAVTGVGAPS